MKGWVGRRCGCVMGVDSGLNLPTRPIRPSYVLTREVALWALEYSTSPLHNEGGICEQFYIQSTYLPLPAVSQTLYLIVYVQWGQYYFVYMKKYKSVVTFSSNKMDFISCASKNSFSHPLCITCGYYFYYWHIKIRRINT